MNAVTTAEYVVVYEVYLKKYQEKLTLHAEQGFRVVSTQAIVDPAEEEVVFTAVMVREPAPTYFTEWQARMTEWEEAFKKWDGTPAFNPEKHFEQIVMLQQKVQTLERQIESVALMLSKDDDLENRLHRLEDQMTDHLRTY
jgi:hypothetical protein